MCGEVPIAEYLSMMSVPRHWDHLSHQNLVTFTRYRIQNLFIKSQHSFLNYSTWLVLSPSQAFTVGRAVPWCANLLMSHWWDFTEWKTWANSSDTRYQPCGSPKAIGKGHKQSSLTGENFKINLSLQIPASSFMAEMWKFTASWIQMGQHTSPNLESLQHCWNMNRLLFLLTLVISFSAANAPNAFHTYTFGATACVLEQGSQAHSPLADGEVANLSDCPQDFQPSPKVPPPACTWNAEFTQPGLWMVPVRGADSAQLAETLLSLSVEHFTIELPE